ncbi:hypothetical protein ACIBF5_02775 [Micromonospora sp. NPDC050417]|uniref:hypothetical protein n=1 Tax=Micromonospora sp. NPDC050417 TaxID=3364280 RepID=UPI0037A04F69
MVIILTRAKRFAHATLAIGIATSGLVLIQSSPAAARDVAPAAAGNCDARKDVKIRDWAPDEIRVIARCSHIAGGTEARGFVDMFPCCNKETAWFTTINKDYYSAYASGNYESVGIDLRDE